MVLQPTLLDRIREKQSVDPYLEKIRDRIQQDQSGDFSFDAAGVLRYRDKLLGRSGLDPAVGDGHMAGRH